MAVVESEPKNGGTEFRVEVTSKQKPDFGIVENESLAERKARAAVAIERRSLDVNRLEFRDIMKLRESPFSMRADYRVKFFLPGDKQ